MAFIFRGEEKNRTEDKACLPVKKAAGDAFALPFSVC
jgi:hypothetical protein